VHAPARRWSAGLSAVTVVALMAVTSAARAGDKPEDRPTERNPALRSRVFELKNRSPGEVMKVIKPLGSGVKGTSISDSGEFKTITVRDFPENIAAIEDALKRLDVPQPPKPDIEFRIRMLIAAPGGTSQIPGDLEPVVKQLHATLNYKGYFQVASITMRVKSGSGAKGTGVTSVNPPVSAEATTLSYSYGFEDVSITPPPPGAVVQIRKLHYAIEGKSLGEAEINTGLSLREGEKVVVGTASLKDRAMILVLSARVVK
jgi:Bacterial type II/III secretion system short domain